PDVGSLNPSELRKLLALNKQVKTLTEDELYTFARLMTMSAADYLDEWFETDVVKASSCSSGIIGKLLWPLSHCTERLHMHLYRNTELTVLNLNYKSYLTADFLRGIENFKIEGSSGKVNLALKEAPSFSCLPGNGVHLRGAISLGPSVDYIEKAYDDAKYGDYSHRPYVDMCVPSTLDPTLAPPGKHIMSCFIQYAPYTLRKGTWEERREEFGETVLDTIEEYIPSIRNIILHRQFLSPWDLEQMIGLTGGNIFHGELTPDQLLFLRPTPGWAQYRMPLKG